ncbi:MAG: carboxypeptidase regulatory-like domain-containing protein [Vicinamibacterales bacterium]
MTIVRSACRCLLQAVLALLLFAPVASAQSVISGLVRDTSGAVLPGVSVEASSPVLIEKVRSVVTDEQGRYTIVDLRPGIYKVLFSLSGFASLEREGLDLPANFTATVNAELKVGALEETVTVSGSSPIVDVQSSQTTINLKRDVLDALPTARTYAAEGSLAIGVKVNSQNVGGARIAAQQRLLVHGANAADNTISVDGMPMMSFYSNGETQPNHNDSMTQEVTVQTVAPGAEVSGGGVFINLVPKEGGNTISGSNFFGYTGSGFQSTNLDDDLRARGLRIGDGVDLIYDFNASLGGPIKRDRLWFFGSYRNIGNANIVANSFYPDGRPGLYDQDAQNYTVRLTWQAARNQKITAYIDRVFKMVNHAFTSGEEITQASKVWPSPLYYTGAVKWSSPVSSKLLLEAGFGASVNGISMIYQPGVAKERGTAEWYASASRQDIALGTRTVAGTPENWAYPPVYIATASASYVTGSNTLKVGVVNRQGPYRINANANADLIQRYRNGVPDSVIVYNTPVRTKQEINWDLGMYVQDSWTYKRLTLNPGVRFEYFNASINAMEVEAGRFVPFRSFPEQKDLPKWFDVAPRFGVVYDLTGDAKTALRFGLNRYNVTYSNNATARYDPLVIQSDTRNWADCDYLPGTSTCSGRVLATNRDGIAQDNEIGPVVTPFGLNRFADPNRQRDYNIQYNFGVDRQLFDGVSLTFATFRRTWYDMPITQNQLVDPDTDYTPFQTTNPLTGQPMTLYNLNPAKAGQARLWDTTSQDRGKTSKSYVGYELTFNARLPRGASLMAGWLGDRTVTNSCEQMDPNLRYNCDQTQFDIPLRHDFKLVGTYPIPLGIQLGAVYQSYAGVAAPVTWAVPASVFPNGRRTQAVTVTISDPGAVYLDRWNQLDLSVRRAFRIGKVSIDGSLDMFNALNGNVVLTRNNQFGTALNTPQSILQPRLFRISSTMKF